jgi:hypothetical protein
MAIIHLYAHGFQDEDIVNFTLRLSNPSTVAQQQKLELWRAKFEIGGSLPEGMGSKPFVYKTIWGLSDKEIDTINEQRLKDKIIDISIEAAGEGGEEGMGGGGGGGGGLFGGEGGGDDLGGDEGDDIFGDEGGGGDDLGGDVDEPPEENAGEEPEEELEPDVELLTSADDADDEERFKLPSVADDAPVKASNQLKHTLYNRSRRRTHGASKTHMPDFAAMTSHEDREDTLKDPYDMNALKAFISNPLGESANEEPVIEKTKINHGTVRMLEKMHSSKRFEKFERVTPGLLSEEEEGIDIQDEIDNDPISTSGSVTLLEHASDFNFEDANVDVDEALLEITNESFDSEDD